MGTKPSLVAHGGWPFLITAFIGRLPPAMVQLGLLMYVTSSGLGLGLGGLTVAAVGLGTAAGATIMGRLVDGFGPLPVVIGATLVQSVALFGVHLITPGLMAGTVPHAALLALAGLIGFANPQVGPIVRSHWSHLSRDRGEPRLVSQALGYEGAMDELSFIIGPIAASLLVAGLGPTPALFALLAIIVVGQGVFIAYLVGARAAWARSTGRKQESSSTRIPFGALVAPMLALLAVGTTFGATQTALTAVNSARGTEELTGIIYGCLGFGSAFAALMTPRLPAQLRPGMRLLFGACGILFAGVAFSTLPSLVPALIVAVLSGLAIGVVLVTGFARAEQVAPSSRIASVMTMMTMCLTLGVSIGAAATGQLAEHLSRGFLPVLAAGALALVAATLVIVAERRER